MRAASLAEGRLRAPTASLRTGAEMLACGRACACCTRSSRHSVASVLVAEEFLQQAVRQLHDG